MIYRTRLKQFLSNLIQYINQFLEYHSIIIFHYSITSLHIKSIKQIRDNSLSKIKRDLKSIQYSIPNYIGELKNKLESCKKSYSDHLNDIQLLTQVRWAIKDLINFRYIFNHFSSFIDSLINLLKKIKRPIKNYLYLHSLVLNQNLSHQLSQRISSDRDQLYVLNIFMSRSIVLLNEMKIDIQLLHGVAPSLVPKLRRAKSKLNKRKLIDYIINLIDTINFIISVEPSEIVNHLKPIYSIKPELESIKSSIKTKDIETNINNLENLYSEIVNIESFSKNMKKLKEYIASVEIHLGGIDSILKSFTNIQNVINSYPLKLILSELGPESYKFIYNSKLKEEDPVRKYMNQMKEYIEELKRKVDLLLGCLQRLMCIVIELKKAIDRINSEIKCLKTDVTNMECAIEGVARNLIRCSLQSCIESIRVNVISPSSRNIDSIYNNIKYIKLKCV